jgi:O-antigen/teichoic acid export membrane protein
MQEQKKETNTKNYKVVIKDAFWQIIGRVISAVGGFVVLQLTTPYLWPLRFWDYNTLLKYFAIWSALADFGLYVIGLRELWALREQVANLPEAEQKEQLSVYYSKFVMSRVVTVTVVYGVALLIAYMIPSYRENIYLVRWLPIGMLFSATFMLAGIVQLPLQLFWKMEQVSIGLTVARIAQLAIMCLVLWLYPNPWFDVHGGWLIPFVLIISTVLVSGLGQMLYVRYKSEHYIHLKPIIDLQFTWNHMKSNRQYGISYYLSSFHTLIVTIILSVMYPTEQWFLYVGIWWLALSLIEILLIIPSSLGNSMIHKVSGLPVEEKLHHFWHLMMLLLWVGWLVMTNFFVFREHIIYFIAKQEYLTSFLTSQNHGIFTMWSDYILPFLGVVITLSFVKQVFNYIFVSTGNQNKLLGVNGWWLLVWLSFGFGFIVTKNLMGWVITQTTLEILYVCGALRVASRLKLVPYINYKVIGILAAIMVVIGLSGNELIHLYVPYTHKIWFILSALWFNWLVIAASYPWVKKIAKGM